MVEGGGGGVHVMPSHRLHLAATMDCQGITVQYIVQPL